MTLWHLILLASIAVLAIKLVGYAVPPRLFEQPRPRRTLELLTVSLLAGLVAAGLFAVRAPFIVAVAAAAAVAAALRQLAGFA